MSRNSTNSKKSTQAKPRKSQTVKSQKRAKQQRRRAKQQGVPRAAVRRQKMYLSECAKDYLEVLSNPFGSASNVCIPDLLDQQSAKYRLVGRGTFVVGTNRVGFIQMKPQQMALNDADNIYFSNALFDGIVTADSGTGVQDTSITTAPYSGAGLGLNKSRLVGLGVRARYIGTELNRGGRMILVRKPYGQSTNALNASLALADRTAISLPVNRRWVGINYLPTDAEDYSYEIAADYKNNIRLAIIIDSEPGNIFEYEIVAYIEYIGTVVNLSPSHSDIVGMSAVKQAIVGTTNTVEPAGPGLFSNLYNYVGNVGADVLSHPTTVAVGVGTVNKVLNRLV